MLSYPHTTVVWCAIQDEKYTSRSIITGSKKKVWKGMHALLLKYIGNRTNQKLTSEWCVWCWCYRKWVSREEKRAMTNTQNRQQQNDPLKTDKNCVKKLSRNVIDRRKLKKIIRTLRSKRAKHTTKYEVLRQGWYSNMRVMPAGGQTRQIEIFKGRLGNINIPAVLLPRYR